MVMMRRARVVFTKTAVPVVVAELIEVDAAVVAATVMLTQDLLVHGDEAPVVNQ
jgi:hypothetical protein